MEEKKKEKAYQSGAIEETTTEEKAIRAAEEEAYKNLPVTMRIGGQAIHSVKKLYFKLLAGRVNQVQEQVIDQDRELSELAHDIGQLTIQVTQMNRLLKGIEARLDQLENKLQKEISEERSEK